MPAPARRCSNLRGPLKDAISQASIWTRDYGRSSAFFNLSPGTPLGTASLLHHLRAHEFAASGLIYNLVRHYKERGAGIRYWEVFNQPDIGKDGGCPYLVTPEDYARYYQHTGGEFSKAIRKRVRFGFSSWRVFTEGLISLESPWCSTTRNCCCDCCGGPAMP